MTNQLCSFPFIAAWKVQKNKKPIWERGETSCLCYGTELACSAGTWWGGSVSVSASSWLDGLLTVAVLGVGVGVGVADVDAVLVVLLRVVVLLLLGEAVVAVAVEVEVEVAVVLLVEEAQLVAGVAVCSSLGCLLANSATLKTNWRQPSLM